jgi:hypothetical protein
MSSDQISFSKLDLTDNGCSSHALPNVSNSLGLFYGCPDLLT